MKYVKPVWEGIKSPFKYLKVYLKQKAGWLDIPKIVPYKGYGNRTNIHISGMVIEDKGLSKPMDSNRVWKNLLATVKRFSSDEIPFVKVKAKLLGEEQICESDELGFFHFHFHLEGEEKELSTKKWHVVHFELLDKVVDNQPHVYATGEVLIIQPEQQRVIISDIDDTVLISHSTQTLRKLRLMLFKNALSRMPFPGVAKFYKALCRGKDGKENNPLVFVSSSEWNLYDLLEDFFLFNHIPKSVLFLRKLNYSIYKFWKTGGGNHQHKYETIKSLVEFYPNQKFILIGDSGQRDPEIYTKIAAEFPGRVEAIYIRKIRQKSYVDGNKLLGEKMKSVNTSYLEIQNTQEAARHAYARGFVGKDAMAEIRE